MAIPTYTFTQKPAPTIGSSNFETLAVDGGHNAMTGVLGTGFSTQDGTTVPVVSPATVTTGGSTITVPLNAVQMVMYTTTNPLLISETSGFSNTFLLPVATLLTIDVAKQGFIYLKGSGGSATVNFYFVMV